MSGPYKSGILNAIYTRTNRAPAIKHERQAPLLRVIEQAPVRQRGSVMVSDELRRSAVKAISYSQYVQDFINDQGMYSRDYNEAQLEAAYRTSVYMFSALRRVANLFSELKIVGEVKDGDEWKRLPETHHLNQIFTTAGSEFLWQAYVFFAMYGAVLIYKRKTRRAVYAQHRGKPITKYAEGAIAGVHIIPNAHWTMREDEYTGEIHGFDLHIRDEALGTRQTLTRDEVVYWHDFDPRRRNEGVSMVSLALNNAVTNAAIARWAAHYFMSGAMPLLLVSTEDDPALQSEADILKYKSFIERAWQGLWGRFNVRAVYTDRKLNVQQAGIDADKVTAPELDRAALNNIASVFQVAPDLIVPPEGGSDNARHKYLMKDAYEVAVLPPLRRMLTVVNNDFGLAGTRVRLVIAEDEIRALEADRSDLAGTELQIFQGGVQTFGETQRRLNIEPIAPFEQWVNVNGRFQSIERVLRDDKLPDERLLQYVQPAWDSGAITLSEYRELAFGLRTPSWMKDGFKYEVVPEPGAGMAPGGGAAETSTPPSDDTPPPAPPAPAPKPSPNGAAAPADNAPAEKSAQDVATAFVSEPPIAREEAPQHDEIRQRDEIELPNASVVDDVPLLAPALLVDEPARAPDPAYFALSVANDPLVATVQMQIGQTLDGVPVQWQDPARWHITLAICTDADDEQLDAARKLLPAQLQPLALQIENLVAFDTPDGLCFALAVEPDTRLTALQSAVRAALTASGLPLHEHSTGEGFTPHITLGYLPADYILPAWRCAIVVEPEALTVGRSDYVPVFSIPAMRDWRDALVPDGEPLEADTHQDPNALASREGYLLAIYARRERLVRHINAWRDAGEPDDDAPVDLLRFVGEAQRMAPAGSDIFAAALLAVAGGLFDLEAQVEENPILKYLEAKAKQATAVGEIDAWEKVALRSKSKAVGRFEVKRVPLAVEEYVRGALPGAGDRAAIRAVFDDARAQVESMTHVPDTDEALFTAWAERMAEMGMDDLLTVPDEPVVELANAGTPVKALTEEQAREIGAQIGIKDDEVDWSEFAAGIIVELEHLETDDARADMSSDDESVLVQAGRIALAHLQELPDYYTRLQKMESGDDMDAGD